jgi:hypothetical protein
MDEPQDRTAITRSTPFERLPKWLRQTVWRSLNESYRILESNRSWAPVGFEPGNDPSAILRLSRPTPTALSFALLTQ